MGSAEINRKFEEFGKQLEDINNKLDAYAGLGDDVEEMKEKWERFESSRGGHID